MGIYNVREILTFPSEMALVDGSEIEISPINLYLKLEPPGGQGAQRVGNKQLDHV